MKKRTVNFGAYNSLNDLNIIFVTLTLGSPAPKTRVVDVPYRDGVLDLTDYYGRVPYTNRIITMNFMIPNWVLDHMTVYHNVQNAINGKKMKIVFSSDDEYYYYGRITVGNYAISGSRWMIPVTADCDPFQYKDLTASKTISSSGYIDLTGGMYNSALEVTSSASCTFTLGTTTKSISATTQTITLPMVEGTNHVEVVGSASISIDYTVGRL